MPCTALATFRKVGSGASPAASEATVKIPTPTAKTRRRPSLSASEPAVSTSAASASVYPSITHCSSVKLAPRSSSIAGSAVFTTVMSSRSMKVATLTASNVHHLHCMSGVLLLA